MADPMTRCPGCGAPVERGATVAARGPALHRRMAESEVRFGPLPAPAFDGRSTVFAVLEASETDYGTALRRWAGDVWAAWAPERPVVLGWLRETIDR